jgi:hypothetical protein
MRAILSHIGTNEGRCTFCVDDGRRCDERRLLQRGHVIPHAQGGEATTVGATCTNRIRTLYRTVCSSRAPLRSLKTAEPGG